jgi:hypothetical protein
LMPWSNSSRTSPAPGANPSQSFKGCPNLTRTRPNSPLVSRLSGPEQNRTETEQNRTETEQNRTETEQNRTETEQNRTGRRNKTGILRFRAITCCKAADAIADWGASTCRIRLCRRATGAAGDVKGAKARAAAWSHSCCGLLTQSGKLRGFGGRAPGSDLGTCQGASHGCWDEKNKSPTVCPPNLLLKP